MIIINNPSSSSNLPNGTLINGVCHIYQSSLPTTRPDGSALVARDKWYNTSTGVEGFWNGTYWLTNQILAASVPVGNVGTTQSVLAADLLVPSGNIFVLDHIVHGTEAVAPQNLTDYWDFSFSVRQVFGESLLTGTISGASISGMSTSGYRVTSIINQYVAGVNLIDFSFKRVASAGSLRRMNQSLRFREVL